MLKERYSDFMEENPQIQQNNYSNDEEQSNLSNEENLNPNQ